MSQQAQFQASVSSSISMIIMFNEQLKETENDELVMALEADGIVGIAQVISALERIEDQLGTDKIIGLPPLPEK